MAEHDKSVMREGEMKNFSVDPGSAVREGEMAAIREGELQSPKMTGAETDVNMNMKMTPEEEVILQSLLQSGMSIDTALDIMASNKVDSMNKLQQLRGETDEPVRPEEFGALKFDPIQQLPSRGVVREGEMKNMQGRTGQAMSQGAMMDYLASKTQNMKGAMGNMLGALSRGAMGGATMGSAMQPPMNPPMMPPQNKTMMRR